MKLYDPRWVRAVKRAIKPLVRASPTLRQQAKARRWTRHRSTPHWILRLLLPLALGVLASVGEPSLLVGLFLLWAPVPLLYRAFELQRKILQHGNAEAFATFPVSDDWLFRVQASGIWSKSWWIGADAAALYLGLAFQANAGPAMFALALLGGFAQWAATWFLSLLLVRIWPTGWFGRILAAWWMFLLGLLFLSDTKSAAAPAIFNKLVLALRVASPAGWAQHGFEAASAQQPSAFLYLTGLVGMCLYLPSLWHSLRQSFSYLQCAPDWVPQHHAHSALDEEGLDSEDGDVAERAARIHASSLAVAEASIQSAEWLEAPHFKTDDLSRWIIDHVLDAPERNLLTFMRPEGVGIGRSLFTAWKIAAYAALALLAIRHYWPGWSLDFLSVLAGWISIHLAVPIFGGAWGGFSAVPLCQRRTGFYALWPLGFAELGRLMLKINLSRAAASLPLCVALGTFAGWLFAQAPGLGAWCGFKLNLILLALQPFSLIFPFSAQTNDSSGWRGCAVWALLLFPVGLSILGAAFFAFASQTYGLLSIPAILFLAWLGGRLYRRAWERGWFDLLSRRQ